MIRLISCIFAASICAASFAVPMASQPWVTNRIASAIAALPPSGVTTNDVCNIVTNSISEWVTVAATSKDANISNVRVVGAPRWSSADGLWIIDTGFDYQGEAAGETVFAFGNENSTRLDYDGSYYTIAVELITRNALGLARLVDLPPLTNGLIGADFISTNNAAFVSAVTNCPVAIAASDAEALAEWGIYGGGGTIGALLAALAAAVAALKKKKMPLYPVGGTGNPVNATYDSGVLTVSPFSMAAYTPTASAAFSVAMGALPSDLESGKARDAVLVIDCSSLTEGQEPTVTWDTHFHPRTDAGTDFACVVGAKNVYYISEYASGEFAVGGWTETAGGNA